MTKQHYEWLAWSIRQIASDRLGCSLADLSSHRHIDYMTNVAADWADQCKDTNPAFNRDRFISAVVNGEW